MESINTYGIKVNLESLEKAAAATTDWPQHSGYTEIYYDRNDGFVGYSEYVDSPINNMATYAPGVIAVARTSKQHSAQWIMDKIQEATNW